MTGKTQVDKNELDKLLKEWAQCDPYGERFRRVHHFGDSQQRFTSYCSHRESIEIDGNNARLIERLRFILREWKNGRTFEDVLKEACKKHPVKTEALKVRIGGCRES